MAQSEIARWCRKVERSLGWARAFTPTRTYRVVLVVDSVVHKVHLHKELLDDGVVKGWDGLLEVIDELLLGVRHRGW